MVIYVNDEFVKLFLNGSNIKWIIFSINFDIKFIKFVVGVMCLLYKFSKNIVVIFGVIRDCIFCKYL